MKAYSLSIKDEDDAGQQIVFAATAKAAKKLVNADMCNYLENYLDLRVHRAKRYDGMEGLSTAELALQQWRDGWRFFEESYPDPGEATDAEFIEWYNDMFTPATNPEGEQEH